MKMRYIGAKQVGRTMKYGKRWAKQASSKGCGMAKMHKTKKPK